MRRILTDPARRALMVAVIAPTAPEFAMSKLARVCALVTASVIGRR
jgi:hypothetical protein